MKIDESSLYPATFEEFVNWFPTEDACLSYIERVRWPGGFICQRCGSTVAWRTERKLLHCRGCAHQTSLIAGTVFEDTRKPLRLWFHVMWMMMSQKHGVSAKNLCASLGFGSYQTVWGWLQKLRSVMVRPGREKLNGLVEVDETYVGGARPGKRGRGAAGKILVALAVEVRTGHLGRVRARCISSPDADCLTEFINDFVEAGTHIVTDGLPAYQGLAKEGFEHERRILAAEVSGFDKAALKHVHLVVSLMKRWLAGTYQGAVSPSHLQAYLDEYAFRFNRRLSTHRGKLFYRLMQEAVSTRPLGIKEFYTTKHNM